MARGIFARADSIAEAICARQSGNATRTQELVLVDAMKHLHRMAVASLVRKSPVFGKYLDVMNSADERDETALRLLRKLPKVDASDGVRALNYMLTVAMNALKNRIRHHSGKQRKAECESYETLTTLNNGEIYEPGNNGRGNEEGSGDGIAAEPSADLIFGRLESDYEHRRELQAKLNRKLAEQREAERGLQTELEFTY